MKKFNFLKLSLLFFVLLFVTDNSLISKQPVEETAKRIMKHLIFLADDKLEGREPGTEGNRLAAEYIANHFKNNNVKPFGNSYYQYFNISTGAKFSDKNEMFFNLINQRGGINKDVKKNDETPLDKYDRLAD